MESEDKWKPDFQAEWIEWYDHCAFHTSTWRDMEEWEQLGPILIISMGFVVREDDRVVILVPHLGDNDKGGGEMCILKTDILLRRPIETI